MVKEIELITNAIASIRSRIVQSPDRIKKHISEMGLMAQDERTQVNTTEVRTREMKTKLDALGVFEQVRHERRRDIMCQANYLSRILRC